MKLKCAVFLLTLFAFVTSVGCGSNGTKKRAAITSISKTAKTDSDTPKKVDETDKIEENSTDKEDLPQDNKSSQSSFDSKKSEDILNQLKNFKLSSLDAEASLIKFEDLKNINLEIEQITVSFKNLSTNELQAFTTISSYKAEVDQSTGQVSSLVKTLSDSTGTTEGLNLLALPILDKIQFDKSGKAQIAQSSAILLAPTVEQNAIKMNNESGGKVLESLFDEMFALQVEEINGVESRLSSTGVDLVTTIERTKDRVSFLIEAVDNEAMVQTFVITFKTTDSSEKKEVTE